MVCPISLIRIEHKWGRFRLWFHNLWMCKTLPDKKLYILQKKAIRHVSGANYVSHTDPLFINNNQLKVTDIIVYNNVLFMHSLRYDNLPTSFNNILQLKTEKKIQIGLGQTWGDLLSPLITHILPVHHTTQPETGTRYQYFANISQNPLN